MKNILLTLCLVFTASLAFGQMKIFSDGKATFGDTANPAQAEVHIISPMTPKFRIGESGDLSDYFEIVDQGIGRCAFNKWGASGQNVTIDYNPRPAENTRTSNFRFFRYTDAANSLFTIFEGKNTSQINTIFASNGDSYFNALHGDVAIGVNNPLNPHKLHVEGSAYKTSGGDTWAIPSDKRLKKNINDFKRGLDIIMDINTVEYEYNGKAGTTDGEYQIGVLAQELQEVAPFMVQEATHQVVDVNEWGEKTIVSEEDILTINASSLKWVLVNAVKEQQNIIDEQNEEIEDLNQRLAYLEEQMGKILASNQDAIDLSDKKESFIGQNIPNPFNDFTSIEYNLPANSSGKIEFFNAEGKVLRVYDIQGEGKGTLDINAADLPSGVYSYRMIVNNNVVGVKQMIRNR